MQNEHSTIDLPKDILSQVTIFGKYARHIPSLNRRETWAEIIERNKLMHQQKYPNIADLIDEVYDRSVLTKHILPSMRSLQFAGVPIERNPSRIYNCAYLPIEDTDAFAEIMFLLLGGTGVGYSVQDRHVSKLPVVCGPKGKPRRYVIGDSIEGWADAVKVLIEAYFNGKAGVNFDYGDIREKGSELVTSGGKAPGPEPLRECLNRVRDVLEGSIGRKLSPINAHDIACYLADAVLAGGIRRAAMISLFSIDDEEMIGAKSSSVVSNLISREDVDNKTIKLCIEQGGIVYNDILVKRAKETDKYWDIEQYERDGTFGWWVTNPQRSRANNSVVLLRGHVSEGRFKELWDRVRASGAGEPGFYWTNNLDWGTNPGF